jgi:hypothetical protein
MTKQQIAALQYNPQKAMRRLQTVLHPTHPDKLTFRGAKLARKPRVTQRIEQGF